MRSLPSEPYLFEEIPTRGFPRELIEFLRGINKLGQRVHAFGFTINSIGDQVELQNIIKAISISYAKINWVNILPVVKADINNRVETELRRINGMLIAFVKKDESKKLEARINEINDQTISDKSEGPIKKEISKTLLLLQFVTSES